MWLIILLLILVAALWLADKAPSALPGQQGTSQEIAPGQTLTEAAEGQVIAGFPEDFILEKGVTTDSSYSIAYADNNTSQPVASYRSKKTLEENVAAYGAYLALNGWMLTHAAESSARPVTFFYATKDTAEVNITFAEDTGGVMVTIAYVTRGE